jgi:hypothetical protein
MTDEHNEITRAGIILNRTNRWVKKRLADGRLRGLDLVSLRSAIDRGIGGWTECGEGEALARLREAQGGARRKTPARVRRIGGVKA